MAAIERKGHGQSKRWVLMIRACLCVAFAGAAIYAITVGHSGLGVVAGVLAFLVTQLNELDRGS